MTVRGYRRRAGAAALILAALAAGRAITTAFETEDSSAELFLQPGVVGQAVELRYADVTATGVDGSSCVSVMKSPRLTPGVWLVVPLRIVTKGEPAVLRYAAIHDRRGRTFLATGSRSAWSPGTGQPGVPRYASVVIEVPADAVEGARLRVALNGLDQRRDHMADIDLRLTRAQGDEWSRRKDLLAVPPPGDRPPPTRQQPAGSCEEPA